MNRNQCSRSPEYALTTMQRDIITPEVVISLGLLIGGTDSELNKALVSYIEGDPRQYKAVIEELSKDILLLFPQNTRVSLGQEIVDRVSKFDSQEGPWLKHLKKTIAFLDNLSDDGADVESYPKSENLPELIVNDEIPKEFQFDPQGKTYTTTESIEEVLADAKSSALQFFGRKILIKMRDSSSSPRDRVPFLNALADVSDELIWSRDRIELIHESLVLWKGTPAVERWCKEILPSVLVSHFQGATYYIKEGQSSLHQLLDYTESNSDNRIRILLAGVAQASESLNSRTLFAVAEEIVRSLNAEETGKLFFWYARRLWKRLPMEDQGLISLADIPNDMTEAISRFLYALMSDIDTRIRWKAAHALRRLALLGCFGYVNTVVSQAFREEDNVFRDPSSPYYFLASKLWLMIALYRISAETPQALGACKSSLIKLATSIKLPHAGIKEYAKRTLIQLASVSAISLTSSEYKQLNQVNVALKGKTTGNLDTYRSFGRSRDENRRFKFDEMDTIPYWYEDILRIFPTVSQNQVLEIAEHWIIDNWHADPEANWWSEEPRKARYDERRYGLWSNRHGSFPIVERYGTHLEWNAMHCVIGELLSTHPISNSDDYFFDSFDYWLGNCLPTSPPEWLSDNRGPTPLELRLWNEDARTDNGWLHNVRRDEYLTEIEIHDSLRAGWIVIQGSYSTHFNIREASVHISSAVVSQDTASALVRALQTTSNPWDFRIPDENDDLQFDVPPYHLTGWCAHNQGDRMFDEYDPFRYEVGQIRAKPGFKLTEMFELVAMIHDPRIWVCKDTGDAAFIYEAWSDEPSPEEDYYPRTIRSEGWRLWAKIDIVRTFLKSGNCDLIYEVQVDRRLRNEYSRRYEEDKKRKTHDKILLLRSNGSIEDAKRCIGSWTSAG